MGLGSGRNSDKVALSAAHTLRGAADAVPLPAQILTGRIVRFALWVREQLPPGAGAKDIKTLFESAAQVLLFGGLQEGAGLQATVVDDEKTKTRSVRVQADVKPAYAGLPFHMEFMLPLKD